jgi:CRP-like cAMP-binding protein
MGSLNSNIDVKFLKECEVLSGLSEEILKVVFNRGQIAKVEPGGIVFRAHQPIERFYVVKSGVVEICREDEPGKLRPVAYLGTSTSIGELSMLTGSNYASLARMPGGGELFAINRTVFLSLLDMLPEFGRSLSTLLAHRLESVAKNSRIDRREQFRGSLKFFDLTTIIQTIVSSSLTGSLTIASETEEPIAEVNFEDGMVRGAFLGNLLGEDAFYQLFQPPLKEGSFDFKSGPIQHTGDKRYDIFQPASALLIEAARQQDELLEMKRKVNPKDIFVPTKEQLLWLGDEAFLGLAEEIFAALKTEHFSAHQLIAHTRRCSYAVYSVLKIMLVTKQIERFQPEKALVVEAQPEDANSKV